MQQGFICVRYNVKNRSTFGKFLDFYLDCIDKIPLPYLFQPEYETLKNHEMHIISDTQTEELLKNMCDFRLPP